MAEKSRWCVVGVAKLLGIGGKAWRKEYAHASSRAQALLLIARRLSEEYKQDVYIGDCDVFEVPEKVQKFSKQEPDGEAAVYQLDLFSSVSKRVV